jgi:hypothetical protein
MLEAEKTERTAMKKDFGSRTFTVQAKARFETKYDFLELSWQGHEANVIALMPASKQWPLTVKWSTSLVRVAKTDYNGLRPKTLGLTKER